MINGKSLKKEVGIFCNFIKLIKLLVKLFMYFTNRVIPITRFEVIPMGN